MKHKYFDSFPLYFEVITHCIQQIESTDSIHPEDATILSPCINIPQEYPHFRFRSIDIKTTFQEPKEHILISNLLEEFQTEHNEYAVAYRGIQRLIKGFENITIQKSSKIPTILKQKGERNIWLVPLKPNWFW